MKKHITLFILAIAGLTSCASVAQLSRENSTQKYPDGIYYKPDPELIAARLKQKEEVQALVLKTHDTIVVPDNMAVKLSFDKDERLTTATLFRPDDYYWGPRWGFHFGSYYDYWYFDRWSFHSWYDPWYYGSWSWRFGWYDPWFYGGFGWYDPWYYGGLSWGFGWYDPWYYGGLSWGFGWYDPWYNPWYGPVYPGHIGPGGYWGPGYDTAIGRRGVYQPSGADRVIDHALPVRNTGGGSARPVVNRNVTASGGGSRPASGSKMTPVKRVSSSSGNAVSRVSTAVSANTSGANVNSGSASGVRKPASNARTIMSSGNNASGQNRTQINDVNRSGNVNSTATRGATYNSTPSRTSGGVSSGAGGGFSGGGAGGARSTGGGGLPSRR